MKGHLTCKNPATFDIFPGSFAGQNMPVKQNTEYH